MSCATTWERQVLDVPMVIINSPYRSFVQPVAVVHRCAGPGRPWPVRNRRAAGVPDAVAWQRYLHNQSAQRLKNALIDRPNTVIIEVPYHLTEHDDSEQGA